MRIKMRPYAGEADKLRMLQLVHAFPEGNVHVVDLPYRLSSWAFDFPENVALWEDGEGNLLAWAALQTPFWTLDYAFSPAALDYGIFPQVLTWAIARGGRIAGQPNGRPRWFAWVFEDNTHLIGDLDRAGFERQEEWGQVYLTRSGAEPVPSPRVPDGFAIRPLAGAAEVELYADLHRATFGTDNMTAAWRARTLNAPGYSPDLDLVAVAPDGRLAAFCICWLSRNPGGEILGQVEPLGVHPDFQGRGLGRALLLENLSRMLAHGAQTLIVEADDGNDPAYQLYTSAGFRPMHKILMLGRSFAE